MESSAPGPSPTLSHGSADGTVTVVVVVPPDLNCFLYWADDDELAADAGTLAEEIGLPIPPGEGIWKAVMRRDVEAWGDEADVYWGVVGAWEQQPESWRHPRTALRAAVARLSEVDPNFHQYRSGKAATSFCESLARAVRESGWGKAEGTPKNAREEGDLCPDCGSELRPDDASCTTCDGGSA